MDNSPAWDRALAGVPRTSRPYQRKDTSHVDAAQRPEHADYDRFVYLLDLFRELKFDAAALYRESPFRVADFGTNAILLRATEDLAALCTELGDPASGEMRACAQRSRAALAALWSEPLGQYLSQDLRTGELLLARTHSTFLAWYAGLAATPQRERALLQLADEWLASATYGLASTHPRAPEYNPAKYWRGPIWPHVNWLVARGLAERGHPDRAEALRGQTLGLIERGGLKEYFHPATGEAFGGNQFAWTAAVVLFWGGSDKRS
jgi:glycogen debranching enzyme